MLISCFLSCKTTAILGVACGGVGGFLDVPCSFSIVGRWRTDKADEKLAVWDGVQNQHQHRCFQVPMAGI